MHEEIEGIKTKYYAAQVSEKAILNKLFEFRLKIMDLFKQYEATKEAELQKMNEKPKFYNGPALAFRDTELSKKIRVIEKKARKMLEWNGDEDVETLCEMFTTYLTAPSGLVMEDMTPVSVNNNPVKVDD